MSRSLQDELKKRGPFQSLEQEATLAIMRTSDLLENRLARLLRDYGLTLTQYNVLRILRGEGAPLPCLEIASRMVQVAPAITRVIEQLLTMGLVTKLQSQTDRRVFEVSLTNQGSILLESIDAPLLETHANLLSKVSQEDLRELLRILAAARANT
jgi:DNA-binding MarR family transcriptional regulator